MLRAIRDQVKGWLAVVIFTLLIIPFAFWGVNYYFDQSGGVVAGKVNGEEITLADYQRAYQDVRRQWQTISDGPILEEAEPLLKEQAIDSLVQAQLFQQTSVNLGLRVSAREVWEIIQEIPAFNDDNGFNPSLFGVAAGQIGLTPDGFMEKIKRDLSSGQLREALLETNFVTESEVFGFSELKHQRRDFSYVVLSSDKLKETIEATDEQVKANYESAGFYMEPEKVRIAYLVLSLAKIAEEAYLEEGELETWFNENKRDYEVEETRKVKQIFVKLPAEPSEEAISEAKAKAEELRVQVKQGRTFEEVVTEDAGDQENIEFSEFGFLTKGVLAPEVDEAAFALNVGDVGEPVRSKDGFHVMGVDEIEGGIEVTLAGVREDVEQDLRENKAGKQLYELTDRLATLTYESPDTLEVAGEELGLEVQESDFVSKEDPGVGIVAEPRMISAAFSEEVLLRENNSDLIELDNDRYVVLRVLEHQSAQKKPLEAVRAQIVTRIKYEQARDQTKEKGELILEKLNDGQSKEALAAEFSLGWKDARGIARDDENTNRAVLRAAFKTGLPAEGKPEFGGASLGTGDYAIVIVHSVTEADQETIEKEELETVRQQLLRTDSEVTWAEFTKDLQANADVEIYDETL